MKFLSLLLTIVSVTSLYSQRNLTKDISIQLPLLKGDNYSIIKEISNRTGLLFVYDSELINNNNTIRISKGSYTLKEIVRVLTGSDNADVKIYGEYAIITIKENIEEKFILSNSTLYRGKVFDKITGEPLIYSSVSINYLGLNTLTNKDGEFKITLEQEMLDRVSDLPAFVQVSHMGYTTKEIPLEIFSSGEISVAMDQRIIPLQEVVVRAVDPLRSVEEMIRRRGANFSSKPAYILAFYREAIEHSKSVNIVESLLKIYKTSTFEENQEDQVKLLKMRRMITPNSEDTLVAKLKSSINTFLQLDLMKYPISFLSPENLFKYEYRLCDITQVDTNRVFVIDFKRRSSLSEEIYFGKIYINANDYAPLKIEFKIEEVELKRVADIFILKKSRDLKIEPKSATYTIKYRREQGKYYLDYVRGDLQFLVKKRWRLTSSNLNVWFEMKNILTNIGDIDTSEPVKPLPLNERVVKRSIFSETPFKYDPDFWLNYNSILLEKSVINLLR